MKISLEEYRKLDLDFLCYTGEQWIINGCGITFKLETDGKYYYLTVDSDLSIDDAYDEDSARTIQQTIDWCSEFKCQKTDSLDVVNWFVLENLPNCCKIEYDEEREEYLGW